MLAIKWKNNKKEEKIVLKSKNNGWKGLLIILLCAMAASTAMCKAYPFFREQAKKNMAEAYQTQEPQRTQELTPVAVDEEIQRYLISSIYYLNYEITPNMNAYEYFTQNYDRNKLTAVEQGSLNEAAHQLMRNMRNQYTTVESRYDYASYASGVEKSYGTDEFVLNDVIYGSKDQAMQTFQAGLVVSYDSRGVPCIRDSWNLEINETELLDSLQKVSMDRLMEDNGLYIAEVYIAEDVEAEQEYEQPEAVEIPEEATETITADTATQSYEAAQEGALLLRQVSAPRIQNAAFAFGFHRGYAEDAQWQTYWVEQNAYRSSGFAIGALGILAVMTALALVLQNLPALELRKSRLFCLPTELTVGGAFAVLFLAAWACLAETNFGSYTLSGKIVDAFRIIGFGIVAPQAACAFIWLFWTCMAFSWYWLTASALPYLTHPFVTLKERTLCLSMCGWIQKSWLRAWRWATDVELSEKLTRNIWKIAGLNGVIVAALSCMWIGGVAAALIYTILLYILMKKKCSEILENYQKLLRRTREIAGGDLNASMEEDMGLFNPLRSELASIQSGFRKAVNEEVRSRNMKAELITNVSHDLKTPLTAIITYVDLLKKEGITEEERRQYIDTLDKKSQRLKALIEDLFEVSKAASDNITMNLEDVDLVSLIKQARLENEDKIAQSTLDFRWNLPEEKCILHLDPQRTFRVIDNLVQNILKYSMPHSRVYIDMKVLEDEVTVSLKNMSAAEMNFSPEEITERFVRGDLSRNTEGSGLGLAIAQSFTELQGGTLRVETDGDLFKVTLNWKRGN